MKSECGILNRNLSLSLQFVSESISAPERVLELGCGKGDRLATLRDKKNCKVLGLDQVADPQSVLSDSEFKSFNFDRDLSELVRVIQDFRPTCILILQSIECFKEPWGILKAMVEAVDPGVRFFFSISSVTPQGSIFQFFTQLKLNYITHASVIEASKSKVEPPRKAFIENTVSVVIRIHDISLIKLLEEAIFSLAIQEYDFIQPVIVTQNMTNQEIAEIESLVLSQPWRVLPPFKIKNVNIPPGTDGRARLLNEGIQQAEGQYLAFLDYDDVVYHHIYSCLIAQLERSHADVAVGGCRRAKLQNRHDEWVILEKDMPFSWGRSKFDLFHTNFIPIHSYVINRKSVSEDHLKFNETLSRLEDYEFLLRIAAIYQFDFSALDQPVCEYRIRLDGSNTVLEEKKDLSFEEKQQWENAVSQIDGFKKNTGVITSLSEIGMATQRVNELSNENAYIKKLIKARDQELSLLWAEHKRINYRVARKFRNVFEKNQLFFKVVKKMIDFSRNIYQKLQSLTV
jgi:ubiquinone/menaquinone biosynthesis C-methylase UbiE